MTIKKALIVMVPLIFSSLLFSSSKVDSKTENKTDSKTEKPGNPSISTKKDIPPIPIIKKDALPGTGKILEATFPKVSEHKPESYDNNKKDYEAVRLLLESKSSVKKTEVASKPYGSKGSGSQGLNSQLIGGGNNAEFNQKAVIESDGSEDLPTPTKSVVIGDSIIVYANYIDPNSKPQNTSNSNLSNASSDPLIGPIMAQNGISSSSGQTSGTNAELSSKNSSGQSLILRLGTKFNGWTVDKLSSTFVIYENTKLKKHIKKYY